MITLPSLRAMDGQMPVRVFMCLTPTDMRCGFDTLAHGYASRWGRTHYRGTCFCSHNTRDSRLLKQGI